MAFKAKPPGAKPSPQPKASVVSYSGDEPLEQDLHILITGVVGSGKSSLALTASEYFEGWHTTKPKEVITCHDFFHIRIDPKASAPYFEHGYRTPGIDIIQLISNPKLYKLAGFEVRPTVFEAVEYALNTAASFEPRPRWLFIDPLSTLGALILKFRTDQYNRKQAGASPADKGDRQKDIYGLVKEDLTSVWTAATMTGLSCIFACHAEEKIVRKDSNETVNTRKVSLEKAAGDSPITPIIVGGSKLWFKASPSLELGLVAKKNEKGELVRHVETSGGTYETKNRFALSLNPIEPPHLGDILKKIKG
jgi:hypothetical protein